MPAMTKAPRRCPHKGEDCRTMFLSDFASVRRAISPLSESRVRRLACRATVQTRP